LQILLAILLCHQDADLIVKVPQAFLSLSKPGFELGPIDQAILVGIEETADAAFDLLCQRLQGVQTVVVIRLGLPSLVLACDPLGLLEQGTDILPKGFFQKIGTHLLVPAEALSPEPIGVTTDASVVGVGPYLASGRLAADAFAIVGVPAGPTDQQTL
jgi:hypothetical protein